MPSKGHSEDLIGFATFEPLQSYYNAFWEFCQVWSNCEDLIHRLDFRYVAR
jgi:hypothetical protein